MGLLIKLSKVIFLSAVLLFIGFVVWMNITPGHYQRGCGCFAKAHYLTDNYVASCRMGCVGEILIIRSWNENLTNEILLNMAKVDFNK